MNEFSKNGSWLAKFRNAFAGIGKGIRGESSFFVHVPVAVLVVGLSVFLQLDLVRVAILLLCIALVIAAELINSCMERMAKAITSQHNQNIQDALDIASGAVLVAVIFASIIGLVILAPPIFSILTGAV